jgi:hypothetical protein
LEAPAGREPQIRGSQPTYVRPLADPVTYQRITLKITTPFLKQGGAQHEWQMKFSLSGSTAMTQADAELTALDLWKPASHLCSARTQLIGWLYYQAGQATHTYQQTYAEGTHMATFDAYVTTNTNNNAQIEVVALVRAPNGLSTKGKPKYLFKHVHDIACDPNGDAIAARHDETTLLAPWNAGSGPHLLVPVSPTTGVQGGPWAIEGPAYTRQLRRGAKKKI